MIVPLDDERTSEYLSSRLHQAGFADAFPFTDKAVSKIQRDSGGLPGNINTAATHYLNGVYRGGDATEKKAGWLSSFEWPVLLVGAAALGLIGVGLSMFFGNGEPDSTIIPVASSETSQQIEPTQIDQAQIGQVEIEEQAQLPQSQTKQPVVATTSVIESTDSNSGDLAVTPASDDLVLPAVPAATEATGTTTETIVATAPSTDLVQEELPTAATISSDPVQQPVSETIVAVEEAPVVNTEPANLAAALNTDTVATTTVPAPGAVNIVDPASTKSVGTSATIESVAVDTSSIQLPETVGSAALPEDDTDASAQAVIEAPIGQPVAIEPLAADIAQDPVSGEPVSDGVPIAAPNRAIENERWVLFQSPTKFTVQLATSRERGYIIDLAQTMQVTDPVAIYPFLTSNSNNPVFGLLSGLYDTRDEAIAAVENMSAATKKFGVWIRPVSDLQEDIKRRN